MSTLNYCNKLPHKATFAPVLMVRFVIYPIRRNWNYRKNIPLKWWWIALKCGRIYPQDWRNPLKPRSSFPAARRSSLIWTIRKRKNWCSLPTLPVRTVAIPYRNWNLVSSPLITLPVRARLVMVWACNNISMKNVWCKIQAFPLPMALLKAGIVAISIITKCSRPWRNTTISILKRLLKNCRKKSNRLFCTAPARKKLNSNT